MQTLQGKAGISQVNNNFAKLFDSKATRRRRESIHWSTLDNPSLMIDMQNKQWPYSSQRWQLKNYFLSHQEKKYMMRIYSELISVNDLHADSGEKQTLTSNSWTAFTTESYVMATCHFIHDWEIQSSLLQTKEIWHTALNLVNILPTTLFLTLCVYIHAGVKNHLKLELVIIW